MKVGLQEEAAKKIARLAEGSMRDALTYLDQCYAMADEVITLDDVNETLGLISDENLDEIISAVKAKDRAATARAITQAFSSGLSANLIAESLITRLRDIEFDMLDRNEKNFAELDNFIDALRKSVGEMNGSGIPDIILEMTLMKLAAPVQNFVMTSTPAQISLPAGNLDEGRKIFYDTLEKLMDEVSDSRHIREKAVIRSFAGDVLTVVFKNDFFADKLRKAQKAFERTAAQVAGRTIKFSVVTDENLMPPVQSDMNESAHLFLDNAIKIFGATGFVKIND